MCVHELRSAGERARVIFWGAEEEGTNECKVTVAVFTDPDCPFNLDSSGV